MAQMKKYIIITKDNQYFIANQIEQTLILNALRHKENIVIIKNRPINLYGILIEENEATAERIIAKRENLYPGNNKCWHPKMSSCFCDPTGSQEPLLVKYGIQIVEKIPTPQNKACEDCKKPESASYLGETMGKPFWNRICWDCAFKKQKIQLGQ